MNAKTKRLLIGTLLAGAGIAVVFFNLRSFSGGFKQLWPFLLLLAGIVSHVYHFSTKKSILFVVLGTFLLVSSVLFFALNFTSYDHFRVLWPGFVAALGLGFLTAYLYGGKKKGFVPPALVLIAAPVLLWILYSLKTPFGLVIGASLFVVGTAFFIRGLIKDH